MQQKNDSIDDEFIGLMEHDLKNRSSWWSSGLISKSGIDKKPCIIEL